MSNRSVAIIIRATREDAKYIRGYLAEQTDSAFADALDPADQPGPIEADGGPSGNAWGRPRLSAPIPALGGARLAMWQAWESMVTLRGRAQLSELTDLYPNRIKVFLQRVALDESLDAFNARWKAATGWIDQPKAGGA